MAVPKTLPAPRRNLTDAGFADRFDGIVAADVLTVLGDFTGGASENMFTLTAHGLSTGDAVYVLGETQIGVTAGGPRTRYVALVASSSVFQLTTDGTSATVVTNTADGTAYLLLGNGVPQRVADAIAGRIIIGGNDFTGGTVEDMNFCISLNGARSGDTIKLLYKSAAGAAAVAADASAYVKSPVNTITATTITSYFQTSATAGGAVLDTTADGTNVWLLTS